MGDAASSLPYVRAGALIPNPTDSGANLNARKEPCRADQRTRASEPATHSKVERVGSPVAPYGTRLASETIEPLAPRMVGAAAGPSCGTSSGAARPPEDNVYDALRSFCDLAGSRLRGVV